MPEDAYTKATRLAEYLKSDLSIRLRGAIGALGDPYFVRSRFEKPRIKDRPSLERKAAQKGWTVEAAIEKAWDFLGFRIVCNNLQDVRRTADLIQEELETANYKLRRIDYVHKPRKTGYRAIHLLFPARASIGDDSITIGCEIQIRTFLQDAWGQLSRADLYQAKIPKHLASRVRRLSDTLARADKIADQIRNQVAVPRRGIKPGPNALLKGPTLAYLYRQTFGEEAPGYLIQSVLRDYGGIPIRTDGLANILEDGDFLDELESDYSEQVPWWSMMPQRELLFRWAVQAAAYGKRAARNQARKEGRQDWDEVDAQYKREISHSIPESMTELHGELNYQSKDGDIHSDIMVWAEYFDATSRCSICGEPLVDIDELASRLVKHYKLKGQEADEAYEKLTSSIFNAGVDDSEGTGLCNHCSYILNKDD